jgi:hypothetical protein
MIRGLHQVGAAVRSITPAGQQEREGRRDEAIKAMERLKSSENTHEAAAYNESLEHEK